MELLLTFVQINFFMTFKRFFLDFFLLTQRRIAINDATRVRSESAGFAKDVEHRFLDA